MNELQVDLTDPTQVTLLRLCEKKHMCNRLISAAERQHEWEVVSYWSRCLDSVQVRIDSLTEQLVRDPA